MRILLYLALIFFCSTLGYGQDTAKIAEGIEFFEAGDLPEAKKIFSEVLETHPRNATATAYLGRVFFLQGDARTSMDLLEKATESRAQVVTYQSWLADAAFTHVQKVGVLKKMRITRTGKAALDKCVELDPQYFECHKGLTYFYQQAPSIIGGSKQKAKKHALRCQEIRPVQGGLILARFYEDEKNSDKSREIVEGIFDKHSKDVNVIYDIGKYHQNKKRYEKATELFELAVKTDPEKATRSLYQIGRTAGISKTNTERGIETLKQYLALEESGSNHSSALWWLGTIYKNQGKKEEARKAFQEILALNQSDDLQAAVKEELKALDG